MKFAAVRSTIWNYSLALLAPFSVKRKTFWEQNRHGARESGIVYVGRAATDTGQLGPSQRTLTWVPEGLSFLPVTLCVIWGRSHHYLDFVGIFPSSETSYLGVKVSVSSKREFSSSMNDTM